MASEGLVGLVALDNYCTKYFKLGIEAHLHAQQGLWELGLLPDPRAMDGPTPGVRLALNYATKELLLSAPDSAADENRVTRLASKAEDGNSVAAAALQFATTGKIQHLKSITLDDVLRVIGKESGPEPTPKKRSVDLVEALEESSPRLQEELEAIAGDWDPDADEFEQSFEVGDSVVNVQLTADEAASDVPVSEGQPPLFTTRSATQALDEAQTFSQQFLVDTAVEVDTLVGGSSAATLAGVLLEARMKVKPLLRWGEAGLDLLILREDMRKAATEYVSSWRNLSEYVLRQGEVAKTGMLQDVLALLDADWEITTSPVGGEQVSAGRLYAIHPFVLAPRLDIARYALEHRGQVGLGAQLEWAQDRSVPAYPAMWVKGNTLIHRQGLARPAFSMVGGSVRPPVRTAKGILDVVRSYVGLHPFAKRSLSILILDPPAGPGLKSAITALTRQGLVDELRVFVGVTSGESVDWTSLGDAVENIGRISNLETWASEVGIGMNIVLLFQGAKVAVAGTHSGEYAPSRGLQNVLTVSLAAPSPTASPSAIGDRIPFVCLQPRDANDIVMLMMQLARSSNREDRFFTVSPMLSDAEFPRIAALASLCDWLVLATPSPIGLVPPKVFPAKELLYIGREDLGSYGLFVYARDLFPVRRRVQEELQDAAIAPKPAELEEQLERLALTVPNGVMRLGRGEKTVTPQIGVMAASFFAEQGVDA
jgi:hypothetical protein